MLFRSVVFNDIAQIAVINATERAKKKKMTAMEEDEDDSSDIIEENAAAALPSVQAAASFDFAMMAMNVVERLLAMLLHIGLTVIVYYGVINADNRYLPLAIILHMLMDLFPAIYQRGGLPLWAVEVWTAGWTE